MEKSQKKFVRIAAVIAVGLFLAIQLVPYGREHTNPSVIQEPEWDTPKTRELAKSACFDCHSNETHWPWYSHVAPTSWLVQEHVDDGRKHLNFSEWNRQQRHADEAGEMVHTGEMPLMPYIWLHPSAAISDADRKELAASFDAMFGKREKRDTKAKTPRK